MVNAELAFMAVMDELDRRGYTSAVLSALEDNPNVNSLYADWRRVRGSAGVCLQAKRHDFGLRRVHVSANRT